MNEFRCTEKALEHTAAHRPAGYVEEISPAIIERRKGGVIIFDTSHPAWLPAVAKYSTGARKVYAAKLVELPADERAIVLAVDDAAVKSAGLGDTLAKAIQALGLDRAAKLYERMSHKKCNCKKRIAWLNRWWPYKSAVAERGVSVTSKIGPQAGEQNESDKNAEERSAP